jgi:hypothetical protein
MMINDDMCKYYFDDKEDYAYTVISNILC